MQCLGPGTSYVTLQKLIRTLCHLYPLLPLYQTIQYSLSLPSPHPLNFPSPLPHPQPCRPPHHTHMFYVHITEYSSYQ